MTRPAPGNSRTCPHCLCVFKMGQATQEEARRTIYLSQQNGLFEGLCEECQLLPRCEVCEVFFDGLVSASKKNPRRCDGCLDFEVLIKHSCVNCEAPIPLYISKRSGVLHYVVRGNSCGSCNGTSRTVSKESKKDNGEYKPQFIGYLALIKQLYDAGTIGKEEWQFTVRRNRHDVMYTEGLDFDIEEEEEEEVVVEAEEELIPA